MTDVSFGSLTDFITHLAKTQLALRVGEHRALDRAAAIIEKSAKAKIGHYQQTAGPFADWAPLAPSTMDDRVSKGFTPDDPLERTGGLRDSISRQVEGLEAAVGSTSEIMVYQELGTPTIPPRAVLGPAGFENKEKIKEVIGEAVVHALQYGTAGGFLPLPE